MIKPHKLSSRNKVAIIAPSFSTEPKFLKIAEESVRFLGLKPILFPSCQAQHGYFAGTDATRAKDINDAFRDESIEGILCLRGGYGTPRLLNMLDYDMIKSNPKLFLGFSDITALHTAFQAICKMTTIHGPMPTDDWRIMDGYSLESLKSNLFSAAPSGLISNPPTEKIETICSGKAEGILVGGNLSLLTATLGTPYEVDTKNKILFIEEVEERPYRIDRMLTSLALADKFSDCAGIIFGTWSDCEETIYPADRSLQLDQIFHEIIDQYKKPAVNNLRAGHVSPQISLPLGTHVFLDAGSGTVEFLEAATI